MANANLVKYIKDNLAAGYQRQDIISALLKVGWAQSLINEGFLEVQKVEKPQPVPPVAPRNIPSKEILPVAVQNTLTKTVEAVSSSARSMNFSDDTITDLSPRANATLSSLGTITSKENKSHSWIIVIALIAVGLVVLGGGTAYMYFAKIGPFSHPPYSENNLVQGILASLARINTSSYALSGSLAVGARDTDAKPFVFNGADNVELIKKYQYDVKRAQDINAILNSLNTYRSSKGAYPSALSVLTNNKQPYSYYRVPITDPTDQPYVYSVIERGKNFTLAIAFETDTAIAQLKQSYKYVASTTPIKDKHVTFTKDSSSYFYLSSMPPKPFLIELSDTAAYLLATTLKASLSARAVTNWKNSNADWQFNINASGDFGDLAYKVDIDALKKNGDYYFKINNLPSLFLGSLEAMKGKWAKIDMTTASSSQANSFDLFSSLASQLPEAEKSYKEQRQEFVDVFKKAASIADEEHLFTLKGPAKSEHIDGRLLYRYDLKASKNAIASFYKRLVSEAGSLKIGGSVVLDPGYVEYLQSPAFNDIFDYYDRNASLTLWVDSQGFPGMIKYSMRVVPPDTAAQLKDKQMNLILQLVLSDINKPVDIQAPKNAKPIQDFIKQSNITKQALPMF